MINKDVVIVYNKFLCPHGENRVLGGIETYLHYLASLLAANTSGQVTIIQPAKKDFDVAIDNYRVIGKQFGSSHKKVVCGHALSVAKQNQSLLIFAADQYSIKTDYKYAISIMHGISWDLPASFFTGNGGIAGLLGKVPFVGPLLAKKYVILQRLRDIQNCKTNVLVDYNSINWYRTQFTDKLPFNYQVILNFAVESSTKPNFSKHHEHNIKVLFARRFQAYRGVDIMANAAKQLLSEFAHVEFCFAGEGPEEPKIRALFNNEPRVQVTKYDSNSSVDFHQQYHIAVVPSIASEGSSLSLAEAMLAGCAVVASDVGGMTNMVLNEYNGILTPPNKSALTDALRSLIVDTDRRLYLAKNAYEVASVVFSHKHWGAQWLDLIRKVDSQ